MNASPKKILQSYNPLILRFFRLVDAFSKADDERDFYLDRYEGFILFADLSKSEEDLAKLEQELTHNPSRYCPIPKLTFYEQKKIMEGFVNEKVYDIDTKEKLLDIISSKNPRQNFLEFLLDHLPELEKWQLFYQERFRIRIIEWLRTFDLSFVFEEDLDLGKNLVEKVKNYQFSDKPAKDIVTARKKLDQKAKTYYSNEALNPRPKRGRPPKQAVKIEIEPQISDDIFNQVPSGLYGFLYLPAINSSQEVTFSSTFSTHEDLIASYRSQERASSTIERLEALSQKLATMHNISSHLNSELLKKPSDAPSKSSLWEEEDDDDEDSDDDEDDLPVRHSPKKESASFKSFKEDLPKMPAPQAKSSAPAPLKTIHKQEVIQPMKTTTAKPAAAKPAATKPAAVKPAAKAAPKTAAKKPAAPKAAVAKKTPAKKVAAKAAPKAAAPKKTAPKAAVKKAPAKKVAAKAAPKATAVKKAPAKKAAPKAAAKKAAPKPATAKSAAKKVVKAVVKAVKAVVKGAPKKAVTKAKVAKKR